MKMNKGLMMLKNHAEVFRTEFKSDKARIRALVLSDSHGAVDRLVDIIAHHLDEIDLVLFLGDGANDLVEASYIFPELTFFAVTGNNDYPLPKGDISFPLEFVIKIAGLHLYLTHGHIASYRDIKPIVASRAKALGASIGLYGHLHVTAIDKIGDVTVINPGSVFYPRGASAASYLMLDIAEGVFLYQFYNAITGEHLGDF